MRFNYIQILRFLAATSVVFFHALGAGKAYLHADKSFLFEFFAHGYLGVDLFFVISGFIIYHTTHKSHRRAGAFLVRRFERIVPLYWAATLALILIAIISPSSFKDIGWINRNDIAKSLLFVTFTDGHSPIVFQGWSLEFEMFFYLCVAAILLWRETAWSALIVAFSLSTVLGCVLPIANNYYIFFTSSLILEFVLGIIISKFICKNLSSYWFAFAVCCAVCATLITELSSNRIILGGIPSAMVVTLAVYLEGRIIIPYRLEQALVILGDASYSIYLMQAFTVSLICKLWVRWMPAGKLDLLIPFIVIMTVLAGLTVHIFVERPMLRFSHKAFS